MGQEKANKMTKKILTSTHYPYPRIAVTLSLNDWTVVQCGLAGVGMPGGLRRINRIRKEIAKQILEGELLYDGED